MLRVSLRRHVDAIGEASSLQEAAKWIFEIGKAIGLDHPGFAEDFSTGPKELLYRDFLAEGSQWMMPICKDPAVSAEKLCPVFRACRVSVDPFVWRLANTIATEDCIDSSHRAFCRRASKRELVGGVTVPVHLPKSRLGAIGWLAVGNKEVDLERILANHSHELRIAGHLFIGQVFRQRPEPGRQICDASLTERELECLTWVALGKTDSEIGEIIGRAPSTARFHVERAIEKLGVNNRTRAAAVACQIGLINALA
jgi:DNA-binding CsgD family transcriptional regulator